MPLKNLTEKDWKLKAKIIIKKEMANKDINNIELSKLLEEHVGLIIKAKPLSEKINRGSFTFYFGMQILNAIGAKNITIGDSK